MPCYCMNDFASLSADFATPHFSADLPSHGLYTFIGVILSKIPLGVKPKGLPLGYTPALAFF